MNIKKIFIIGLGNSDQHNRFNFNFTYHNLGLDIVKEYIKNNYFEISINFNFSTVYKHEKGINFIITKSFINDSYKVIEELVEKKVVNLNNDIVIVAYDDLNMYLGEMGFSLSSLSSSHNGIRGIKLFLNSHKKNKCYVIKLGINKVDRTICSDYVLSELTQFEKQHFFTAYSKNFNKFIRFLFDVISVGKVNKNIGELYENEFSILNLETDFSDQLSYDFNNSYYDCKKKILVEITPKADIKNIKKNIRCCK